MDSFAPLFAFNPVADCLLDLRASTQDGAALGSLLRILRKESRERRRIAFGKGGFVCAIEREHRNLFRRHVRCSLGKGRARERGEEVGNGGSYFHKVGSFHIRCCAILMHVSIRLKSNSGEAECLCARHAVDGQSGDRRRGVTAGQPSEGSI